MKHEPRRDNSVRVDRKADSCLLTPESLNRRAPARRFEDLIVWQKAHAFVLEVYRVTAEFPKHELYGLTSQFRRAAVSIPANIAEGFRKQGAADKARFLNTAEGSLEECRYYLILAKDLGYPTEDKLTDIAEEVSKLLYGFRKSILTPAS
jgi:four helix bundle protein